jgi:alpha-L-rhamnosidase
VPRRVLARASALGVYELSLNGNGVSDALLRPGWTDYHHRLQYQEIDVTGLVVPGRNVLGALVGPGWYAGRIAGEGGIYQREVVPELLVELNVERDNGQTEVLAATDETWEWMPSAILASDLYDGEVADLRLARAGWNTPSAPDLGRWEGVELASGTSAALVPELGPPIRELERREVAGVAWLQDGTAVVDGGRNETGFLRLRVTVPAGTRIAVAYGELLDVDGRVYRANLRSARCIDEFMCAGGTGEELSPSFSIRGFRYAEIRGLPGPDTLTSVERVVVGSDLRRTGHFSCSEPLLDAISENVLTSQRSNFVEVPTDCPQRDERLGWMADALLFAPLAAFQYDIARFMSKWLEDVLDARTPGGCFADIAPRPSGRAAFRNREGAPGWADAGVLLPWLLYQRYNDRTVLKRMFPAIMTWLRRVHRANPSGLWTIGRGRDFGDWLPAGPDTSHTLFSTCWLYRSTNVAAAVAALLGATEEERWCRDRADVVRAAFADTYLDEATGRIRDEVPDTSALAQLVFGATAAAETQTGYVLPLVFGLVEGEVANRCAGRLVDLVERAGNRLETGFIGSAFLLEALERSGHSLLALDLLLCDEFPSLGYMVRRGSTSIWERWDGLKPGFGPACPTANSYNHFGLGSMFSWAITGLCGLRPSELEPGFARFGFAPVASSRLQWAKFAFESPSGALEVGWSWSSDSEVCGEVLVPKGARCALACEIDVDGGRAVAADVAGALSDLGERSWPNQTAWQLVDPGRHEVRWQLVGS